MAVGVVAINGLKGAIPAWISQGDSAAIALGNADIPQVKNVTGIQMDGDAYASLSFIKDGVNPIYYVSGTSGYNALNFTFDGFAHYIGSGAVNGGAASGNVFAVWNSANPSVDLGPVGSSPHSSGNWSVVYMTGNYKRYDYSSTPSNIMCRHSSGDLSNPVSGFSSWGTEFTSGQYSDTGNWTDSSNDSFGTDYIAFRVTGLSSTNFNSLMPAFAIQGTASSSSSISAVIWNFNTSTWDGVPNYSISGSGVGTATFGWYTGHGPLGGIITSPANYISSGTAYVKVNHAGSTINLAHVGYVGLIQLNVMQNAQ